jgi:hypothetical protein
MTKRHAHEVLDALLKLEMISPYEFQHDKNMVSYETTIRGNALGMRRPVLCGTGQLGNPLIDRGPDWHRIKNIVRFWTDIPMSPLRLYRGGGVWSQICQKLTRIGWVAR